MNVGDNIQNGAEVSRAGRGEEEEVSTMDEEGEHEEEEESDDLASALNGLQAQAANTIWCLCIAHPSNKERVRIHPRISLKLSAKRKELMLFSIRPSKRFPLS